MGALGILAAIVVLVGGVQTAFLAPAEDPKMTGPTPTTEVQQTETHHTLAQSDH